MKNVGRQMVGQFRNLRNVQPLTAPETRSLAILRSLWPPRQFHKNNNNTDLPPAFT